MAIEDISVPKAPAGWQPSADQRARIANDPRLRRMSRDELYAMFGNKGGFSGAFHERAQQQRQQAQPQGGSRNPFGRAADAMRNARR